MRRLLSTNFKFFWKFSSYFPFQTQKKFLKTKDSTTLSAATIGIRKYCNNNSVKKNLLFLQRNFGTDNWKTLIRDRTGWQSKSLIQVCIIFVFYTAIILCYRKFAIDRPGGIQFFATHNFWTTHFRIIK